ncbi:hypothetical protein OH76DRAFT_516185 [Lentinus brumalis]|uniref:Uncharacterized protein n=1 Tax=Lentinus brumalis TaxID=2498619 RepID=A0A371CHR9_9APHY|nr:hypothetical protein OH76DRAFT_516185 [Polyporus brumalis]
MSEQLAAGQRATCGLESRQNARHQSSSEAGMHPDKYACTGLLLQPGSRVDARRVLEVAASRCENGRLQKTRRSLASGPLFWLLPPASHTPPPPPCYPPYVSPPTARVEAAAAAHHDFGRRARACKVAMSRSRTVCAPSCRVQ